MKISTEARPGSGFTWADSPISRGWLTLGVGFAVICWMYREVFGWLYGMWQSPDYSHGFLVPPFVAFLVWKQRKVLADGLQRTDVSMQEMLVGGGLLVLGLAIRLVGIYTRVWTLEGIALVPFLLGLVAIVGGTRVCLKLMPALLFLVFMIPLPGAVSGKMAVSLQTVATNVSRFGLQTAGVPTVSEGNIILLESGEIGVAEACSGLRMLHAFFAITVGSCLIFQFTWWEKLFVTASAVPIAVAVNCLRIICTGLALQYTDQETAEYVFHDLAGWLMMPAGIGLLAGVLWFLDHLIVHKKT